jgi:hypothetical protein
MKNPTGKANTRKSRSVEPVGTRSDTGEESSSITVLTSLASTPRPDPPEGKYSPIADAGLAHSQCGERCAVMASSCGDGGGHDLRAACPSPFFAAGCADLLQELSNLQTTVLLNTQRLQWMLPRYSRLKRTVVDVARSAQRSNELLKQLQRRCVAGQSPQSDSVQAGAPASRQSSWPSLLLDPAEKGGSDGVSTTRSLERAPSPGFDLTAGCDTRTSDVFPKRNDMDGRQLSR